MAEIVRRALCILRYLRIGHAIFARLVCAMLNHPVEVGS